MWKCITTLYTVTGSVGECECMSPLAECWPATERRAEEESWESPHAGETQLGSTGTQQHQPHQPEVTCRHHNRYLYTVDIRWLELAGNILALVRSRQRQARSGLYKSSKHLMKTLISMQIPGCSVAPMLLWWFLEPILQSPNECWLLRGKVCAALLSPVWL